MEEECAGSVGADDSLDGVPSASRIPLRGYVAAFLAAFFFGSNGTVVKVVMASGISPEQLTFFRCATTALLAAVAVAVVDPGAGFRLSARDAGRTLALGIVGVACVQWFYAAAIQLLPVGIVLLIEYTAVLMVALVARFVFRERVKQRLWAAIGLVLVGLGVVAIQSGAGGGLNPLGAVLALAGAVSYATYFLLAERQLGTRHPLSVTFWSMLWASLLWAVLSGWWRIDPGVFTAPVSLDGNLSSIDVPLWLPLLWACTMGSFVPFALSYTALSYMPATSAGIIASSEILWAFAVAWAWLGEALSVGQLIGVCVVVVGIVLAQSARPGTPDPVATVGPVTMPIPVQHVTPAGTGETAPRRRRREQRP